MSLLRRVPRPLKRNEAKFRDDRLFIVACDDTFAPKQYFDFFQFSRVKIHVVETSDGSSSAPHVLNRLLGVEHESDDERWMLLDVDHCCQGTHLASFVETLAEAKRQGIQVALSKPCFELWLLRHHTEGAAAKGLADADAVERALRNELGEYNKRKLKAMHYPCSAVYEACVRAERLDQQTRGGEIPNGNTTRVYQLWSAIVRKALPSQLPVELHQLLAMVGADSRRG